MAQSGVHTATPVFPWIGGKRNLAKRVIERIDSVPHRLYCEPAVGAGGIILRKPPSRAEVINDINTDVVNLFRILQRHFPQLMDTLRFQLTSRADFERLQRTDPSTLTDLERAARFLYLQRLAWGGKVEGQNFGIARERPARFNLVRLEQDLADAHERLAPVVIERLPMADCIARYDGPEALFYVDPPYWGSEDDYGRGVWDRQDFAALAEQLRGIKGRFLLSINDVPEIRELFAWAEIEEVQTTYTVGRANGVKAAELLISG